MGLLSHTDVSGGLSDFWNYIREPRPHRWACWGLALVLPALIFYGFNANLFPYPPPKSTIIYIENWKASRSEADVLSDWRKRAIATNRANAERRAEYQRLADQLGIPYNSSKADKITREALGAKVAAELKRPKKLAPPARSDIAERAARGPQPNAAAPAAQ